MRASRKAAWATALFLSASVSVGLPGCGGGGSSGGPSGPQPTPTPTENNSNPNPNPTGSVTPLPTQPVVTPTPGQALLFSDEFNTGSLDTSNWVVVGNDNFLQRTQFGNQPTFGNDSGTSFIRLPLNTYNPDAGSRAQGLLYATQIVSLVRVARGQGVEFEARMRVSEPSQRGLVMAFFAFGDKGNFDTGNGSYSFDELDHEILTNRFNETSARTWTNTYNDFRPTQPGFSGDSYNDTTRTLGAYGNPAVLTNKGGFNVYLIRWLPDRVQWLINGTLIREDSAASRLANEPLGVRLNIWAADPFDPARQKFGWIEAYDGSLRPVSTPGQNQTFGLDVDYVRVRNLVTANSGIARSGIARFGSPLIRVSRQRALSGVTGSNYQTRKGPSR